LVEQSVRAREAGTASRSMVSVSAMPPRSDTAGTGVDLAQLEGQLDQRSFVLVMTTTKPQRTCSASSATSGRHRD